jgi:hypothetical protein
MARGGARPGTGRKPGFISEHRKFPERTKTVRVPETWDVAAIAKTLNELRAITERWRERIGDGKRCTQPRWKYACDMLKEIEGAVEGSLKK